MPQLQNEGEDGEDSDILYKYTKKTPLEIIAEVVYDYAQEDIAKQIFDAYDAFLGILDNKEDRKELEELAPNKSSKVFERVEDTAENFDNALQRLFFVALPRRLVHCLLESKYAPRSNAIRPNWLFHR